jgi:hypothetical protein
MPPAQTIISGQQRTNLELQNSQVIDISNKVFQFDPAGSPMMRVITERSQTQPAKNTTIRWMEDAPVPTWYKANATINSSATSLVTTEASDGIVPGDLLKVMSSGEVVRVTANNTSTKTLTIVRAFGGTAASISATNWLLNLRGGQPEGDSSVDARATVKVEKTNYTEIWKTSVEMSRTITEVDHYGFTPRDYERKKAGETHALSIERSFLFGRKKEDLTGARPIRAAGGFDEFVTTNRFAVGGALNEADFLDWVMDCFRYSVSPSRSRKLLICSREVQATIAAWGLNKLTINDKARSVYGMEVTDYVTPAGTLSLIPHRLLENGAAGSAYLIDPDGIYWRPLHSTELRTNIQANDVDGYKDEFLTEGSFQYVMDEAHGALSGVTYADWTS